MPDLARWIPNLENAKPLKCCAVLQALKVEAFQGLDISRLGHSKACTFQGFVFPSLEMPKLRIQALKHSSLEMHLDVLDELDALHEPIDVPRLAERCRDRMML